jgi:hypothetical protein
MAEVRNVGLSDNAATALFTVVNTKAAELWYVTHTMWRFTDVSENLPSSSSEYSSPTKGYFHDERATQFDVSYLPIDKVHSRRRESKTVTDRPIHSFPMVQQPQWAMVTSLWELLDHTQTQHTRQDSSGLGIGPLQGPLPDNTQHSQKTDIHVPGGIRIRNPSKRAAAHPRLRSRGHPPIHACK